MPESEPSIITPLKPDLQVASEKYGHLEILEIKADTFSQAFEQLGEINGEAIREAAMAKIANLVEAEEIEEKHLTSEQIFKLRKDRLKKKIKFAEKCWEKMKNRQEDTGLNANIKAAFSEVLIGLELWSKSSGLEQICEKNEVIQALRSEGVEITPLHLAVELHNDNVGCQTGIRRQADGSVIFWHMEEDAEVLNDDGSLPEGKLSQRLVQLSIGKGENAREILAFDIPSLLPGGAFFVEDKRIVGVDSYYLKSKGVKPGTLANLTLATMLALGKTAEIEDVAKLLGPHCDGYAVSEVKIDNSEVIGKVVEFLGKDVLSPKMLGRNEGNRKTKVNLADRRFSGKEEFERGEKTEFEKRIHRFERWFNLVSSWYGKGAIQLQSIMRLMQNRVGGTEWSNANVFTLAHCAAQIFPDGKIEFFAQSGPAIKGETPKLFKIGIDGKITEVV